MVDYHVNSQGNVDVCTARLQCRLKGVKTKHYPTKEEAVTAFEKTQNVNDYLQSTSKQVGKAPKFINSKRRTITEQANNTRQTAGQEDSERVLDNKKHHQKTVSPVEDFRESSAKLKESSAKLSWSVEEYQNTISETYHPTRKMKNKPINTKPEDYTLTTNEEGEECIVLTDSGIKHFDRKFKKSKTRSDKEMKHFTLKDQDDKRKHEVFFENGKSYLDFESKVSGEISGKYPIGDLTQKGLTVKYLIRKDPSLSFINGDCARLAHEMYNSSPEHVAGVAEIVQQGSYDSVHVVAQLRDGSYIDSLGHWSPAALSEAWKDDKGPAEIRHYEHTPMNEKYNTEDQSGVSKTLKLYLETVYRN